jgi:hypothetical protein
MTKSSPSSFVNFPVASTADSSPRPPLNLNRALLCYLGVLLGLSSAGAADPNARTGAVAVYSSISPDYVRTALPGGGFKTETYSFGEGGRLGGGSNDFSIDGLKFLDIARLVAPSLKSRNYTPSRSSDPNATDLLIMIYWGVTDATDRTSSSAEYQTAQSLIPPPLPPPPPPPTGRPTGGGDGGTRAVQQINNDSAQDQAMLMIGQANSQHDRQNYENAKLLGYLSELNRVAVRQKTFFAGLNQDIMDDIEESRYFVVLIAYDFETLRLHKQRKIRWETRFSIRERGNDFSKQLEAMSQYASRYYGKDSQGLIRKDFNTSINLGELKILSVEPEQPAK